MRAKYLLAGAGLAAVLSAVALVAVVLEWWWLAAASLMALVSAVFLVALDTNRRVRRLRPYIRSEADRSSARLTKNASNIARTAATSAAQATEAQVAASVADALEVRVPMVPESEVLGAVRVLQAQYLGRLDRLQGALDEAVAALRAEQGRAGNGSE